MSRVSQTLTGKERTLDAIDFDAILDLFNEVPERPDSTEAELRWNSCLRDAKAKFHYRFRRG